MIFWALGGGQNANAQDKAQQQTSGLDIHLPDPQKQDDKGSDKLSFYQDAEKDSAKLKDELSKDPYHRDSVSAAGNNAVDSGDNNIRLHSYGSLGTSANTIANYNDPNEEKINQKMAELYKQINDAQTGSAGNSSANTQVQDQMQQMKAMMNSMNKSNTPDPDMQQLSGMLDKILYIEHPEMAKEKIREQSLKNKRQVYTVSTTSQEDDIQIMEAGEQNSEYKSYQLVEKGKHGKYHTKTVTYPVNKPNSFYEWSNVINKNAANGNTVEAVVAETRTLVTGATIKLRLLNNIYINGALIPKDQFIYGTCSISGDRLLVNLSSVRYNNSIYPVALAVYDMDGLTGVYMPDAISRQVSKGSADQAIQGVDLYAFDNTLTGQAASAGVQAAKGLFSKKAELIKVTVKEGYKVFLKNTDENN
jgi:conjugative transposon TraM protein